MQSYYENNAEILVNCSLSRTRLPPFLGCRQAGRQAGTIHRQPDAYRTAKSDRMPSGVRPRTFRGRLFPELQGPSALSRRHGAATKPVSSIGPSRPQACSPVTLASYVLYHDFLPPPEKDTPRRGFATESRQSPDSASIMRHFLLPILKPCFSLCLAYRFP